MDDSLGRRRFVRATGATTAAFGVNQTGQTTGPHVHFGVTLNGEEVSVAGAPGEQMYARTGVGKNDSGH